MEQSVKLNEADEAVSHLSFKVGTELFGVSVMKTLEVIDYTGATVVPNSPEHMVGVINLRGKVIPIFDLHSKFGCITDRAENRSIVVLNLEIDGEADVVVGVIVDAVEEVFDLFEAQIEAPPTLGTNMKQEFLRGLVNINEKILMLLNAERIFEVDDVVIDATEFVN